MNLAANPTSLATSLPFAMYDAFTDIPYAGSQAAIILEASETSYESRVQIAREIGFPATSFVNSISGNQIIVQFFSTFMELPMCGHGTVCLITYLVKNNLLPCAGDAWHSAILKLPKGDAKVEYRNNQAGRVEVMLDVKIAQFTPANLDFAELTQILNVETTAFSTDLPAEIARGDFIHLCLPMCDLNAIQSLQPDFTALTNFCTYHGLETVATFSTEVVDANQHIHVRDFCPAVGVAESAAAGTTNATLANYLVRNEVVKSETANHFIVRSEQGIELGRPSKVVTMVNMQDGQIKRLQVGGVASQVVEGKLNIKVNP